MSGVINTIFELIVKKPMSREEILDELCKRFPDREPHKMMKTINIWIPGRLVKEKNIPQINIDHSRHNHRYYIQRVRPNEYIRNIISKIEKFALDPSLYGVENTTTDIRFDYSSIGFTGEQDLYVTVEVYDYDKKVTMYFNVVINPELTKVLYHDLGYTKENPLIYR